MLPGALGGLGATYSSTVVVGIIHPVSSLLGLPHGKTPVQLAQAESCANVLSAAGQKVFDPAGSLVLERNFV